MKRFKQLSEHVFDGRELPTGADKRDVAELEAIRDALKAAPVPECRLTADHLRSAVLDAAASRPRRPVLVWAAPLAAVAALVVWASSPRSRPAPAAPAMAMNDRPQAVPEAAIEPPPARSAVAAPESAEPARKPEPKRKKRPVRRRAASPPPIVALADATVPDVGPAAEATPRDLSAPPPEPPSEEVVIVQEPSGAVGAAIEVELGQEVVFGG
jgi:hypothetical protein